jgi:hypothetical protein
LGNSQFSAPRDNRGLAISPDGRYLYAGYNNGPEVRKIDLTKADYTEATVARTTVSRGKAITVDDQGRVYLAEGGSIKILDANLSSVQYTISGAGLVAKCEGIAVQRDGETLVLYATERGGPNTLTRWVLTENGGVITGAARAGLDGDGVITIAGASDMRGLAIDSAGRIWIADPSATTGNGKVFRVDSDGASLISNAAVPNPYAIAFKGDQVLVTGGYQRVISVLDIEDLSITDTLTPPLADLELDPDGNSSVGSLTGIVVTANGFYVTNEAGQTANEKSTYGVDDANSGDVDGKHYTDLTHDDNDPILFAANPPSSVPSLTVRVQDSLGNPVEGVVITHAIGSPNGGWQTFGTTGADGTVSRTDLTVGTDYHFYASYNASNSLTQVVTFDGDDLVTFQTVPVKVKVETCTGTAVEGAGVTYGSVTGGFLTFGSTDATGITSRELFPGYERTFYANFNNTKSALQTVTIADQVDPLVVFKTTTVTINYAGSINHGSANGGWYPFTKPSMEMFAGTHTFLVNGTQVPVQVSGCSLTAGTLTVKFPGISSVHTYLRKTDSVAGTATGQPIAEQTHKTDQAVFTSLPNGVYDLVLVKGAKTKIVDDVVVIGDQNVENLVATLTVNFPGISSVHTYVKLDDGAVGTVGAGVDERTYKDNSTSLAVLKGAYDVLVVKNAKQLVVDSVDCTGSTCEVTDIVKTLTVNFPGISSVHTYVKLDDGAVGTVGAGVDERTYKNDTTSLVVLKGMYDVLVVKNAKQLVVNSVDCTDTGSCTVDDIVATLTIKFPGMTSVHSYVKLPDGIDNTATGGGVDSAPTKIVRSR